MFTTKEEQHGVQSGVNRTEPHDICWRPANSIVRQAFGCHFIPICVIFLTKEEQHDVIHFLVEEGVGVSYYHMCEAIKANQSGLLSSGVVLLHDNLQPHTKTRILNKLTKFG
ncbi:hypothetical protein AVEN_263263-1 [Araneus ventricosus]|uniref:Uncharacterized protein n=1 Tax=Araneus ventricosus TaxID=182803 RepID=A0A4Y2V3A6_ARAVE|nr:hypothetical protein AVEN_47136-1 [Araneus ventricosus]GBO19807.1 hypothetical protein AVEN_263263-1 [Araneus ventricosus]